MAYAKGSMLTESLRLLPDLLRLLRRIAAEAARFIASVSYRRRDIG